MRFARFPRAAVASAAENFVLSGRRLGHTKAGEPAKLFSAAPPADAEAISHIAFGFMASKALFAALDVKLFAQLSGGRSLSSEELASEVRQARVFAAMRCPNFLCVSNSRRLWRGLL